MSNEKTKSELDAMDAVLGVAREQLAKAIEANRAGRLAGRQMELARTRAALTVANAALAEITERPAGMIARLDLFNALLKAGSAVVAAWESGDLAAAVRTLDQAVTNAKNGAAQ